MSRFNGRWASYFRQWKSRFALMRKRQQFAALLSHETFRKLEKRRVLSVNSFFSAAGVLDVVIAPGGNTTANLFASGTEFILDANDNSAFDLGETKGALANLHQVNVSGPEGLFTWRGDFSTAPLDLASPSGYVVEIVDIDRVAFDPSANVITQGSVFIEVNERVDLGGHLSIPQDLTILATESGGQITNSAAAILQVAGQTDLTADSIDLGNQANDMITLNALAIHSVGIVSIHENSGFELSGDNQAGALNLTSSGTINISGPVVATSISVSSLGASSDISIENVLSTNGGPISITSDHHLTFSAIGDLTSNGGNVSLRADELAGNNGGQISMADGTLVDAGIGSINLQADGAISLGGLRTNNATSSAVSITTTSGAVFHVGNAHIDIDADAVGSRVTIATALGVGDANPITTSAYELAVTNITAGNVRILESNSIRLNRIEQQSGGLVEFISNLGSIEVLAGAGGVTSTAGSITLAAHGATADVLVNDIVRTTGGPVNLFADRSLVFSADGDVTSSGGNVSLRADEVAGNNGGQISMADGTLVDASSGQISLVADGDISLGGLRTANATASSVFISTTSGGILDGGDTHIEIDANSIGSVVTLAAQTGIGSSNPLETRINELSATNVAVGNVQIFESDSLRISLISQLSAGLISILAGGTTEILAGGGGISSAGSPVTIQTLGVNSNLIVADEITTTGGAINLISGDDIQFLSDGDVNSLGGNVLVRADAVIGNLGGQISMADGALVDAGSGRIELEADGDITLGGLITSSVSALAVQVTSTSGAILDGGDTHIEIDANSIGGVVTLAAQTGIGSSNPLETRINELSATNVAVGNVQIFEGDSLRISLISQLSAGLISILAGGTTEILAGGGGISSAGSPVTIQTLGVNSNLIVADEITTTGGAINLISGDDIQFLSDGDVNSLGGNVLVRADAVIGNLGGQISMADGALVDAGSGRIELEADGDITLGGLKTSNVSALAVQVTSTSGAILDGGDTHIEIDANSIGSVVTLAAQTGIGSNNPLETRINELSATNVAVGNVQIFEGDSLRISLISQLSAGLISILAGGTTEILAGGGGVFSAGSPVTIQTLGVNSNLIVADEITTTGGAINLISGDDIQFLSDGDVSSLGGNVLVRADAVIGNLGGQISMADGALVDAGSGRIELEADGDITLGGLVTANGMALAVQVTSTSGAILDGGDTHIDINANAGGSVVTLVSNLGIGNSNPLETRINQLSATNTTAGAIRLSESDAINLGRVDQQGPGAVAIVTSGSLSVLSGLGGISANSGPILLDANGNGSDLSVSDLILSSSGQIELFADRNVIFTSTGNVLSMSGNVIVRADELTGANGGQISMADGSLINAGSGQLSLTADGNVTLGGLKTLNATSDAITIISSNGSVLDGGDLHVDIVANTAGSLVTITARHGIGNLNPLETQINELAANVTDFGDILVSELDNLNARQLSTLNGDIGLIAGGSLFIRSIGAGGDGDVALVSGGDMVIESLAAIGDEILLRAGGKIDDASSTSMVQAQRLSVIAGGSVHLHDTHVSEFEGSVGANSPLQSFQTLNGTADRVGGNILGVLNQNLPPGISQSGRFLSGETQGQVEDRFSYVSSFGREYALYIVNTGSLKLGDTSATGHQPHIYIETKGTANLDVAGTIAVNNATAAAGGMVLVAGGQMAITGGELVTTSIIPALNQQINTLDLNFNAFHGGQGPSGKFDLKATSPQFLSTRVVVPATGAENAESHIRQRISTQFGSAGESGFLAIARYADGLAQLFDTLGEVDLTNSRFSGALNGSPAASIAAYQRSLGDAGILTRATSFSTEFLSTFQSLPTTIVMRRSTDFFLFEDGGQTDLASQSAKVLDVISLGDKISLPLVQDPKLVEAPRPISYQTIELPQVPIHFTTTDFEFQVIQQREPEVAIFRVAFDDKDKDGQVDDSELPSFDDILREGPQKLSEDPSGNDSKTQPSEQSTGEPRPGTRLGERIPVKVRSGSSPTAEDIDAWKRELQSDPQQPSGAYAIIEKDVNQKETVLDVFPVRDWDNNNGQGENVGKTPLLLVPDSKVPPLAPSNSAPDEPASNNAAPGNAASDAEVDTGSASKNERSSDQPAGVQNSIFPQPTDGANRCSAREDSPNEIDFSDETKFAGLIVGALWTFNTQEPNLSDQRTEGTHENTRGSRFSGATSLCRAGRQTRRILRMLQSR